MPALSPDRDPSPPSSHHPPANDEEHAAADESTPFLTSETSPSYPRTIHLLTTLALTFSLLTLASLFATAIALQVGPVSFNLPWSTKEGLNGVVAPVCHFLSHRVGSTS